MVERKELMEELDKPGFQCCSFVLSAEPTFLENEDNHTYLILVHYHYKA